MTPDLTHDIIKLLFIRLGGHKNLPDVADKIVAIIDQHERKAFLAAKATELFYGRVVDKYSEFEMYKNKSK